MATHDYNIANQGFPAFRADLNDALAAIVSNNSNATAPATTFAHQWWMDTSANPSILKVRNADNDAWITLGTFNQSTDTFTPSGVTSDKIEEGNSKVEVVDSGTGYIVFEVDGAEVARFNPDQFVTKAGTASTPAVSPTGDLNTGIFFPAADTIAFAEGGAEAMRINSSGNVGIGTTSPSSPASFAKTATIADASSASWSLNIGSGTYTGEFGMSSGGGWLGTQTAHPLRFIANTAERSRITSDGNFLWGATTLAGVSGADAKGIDYPDGMRLFSSRASTAAREHVIFYNPNGDVGSIDTTGSATAYNTSSDYRLKENISPLTNAISTISQLKPSTWTWKVDGSIGQGFIAHELQEIIPDCVTGEKDAVETYTDEDGNEQTRPKYQGVDTSFLVATLTAAIQELKAINDAQASRIETLEAKVAALEGN